MVQERKLMTRMTEELHKAVRVKAAELGRPVSEIVRELLARWVSGEIELPIQEKEQPEQE
jgi:plasmid stability protein